MTFLLHLHFMFVLYKLLPVFSRHYACGIFFLFRCCAHSSLENAQTEFVRDCTWFARKRFSFHCFIINWNNVFCSRFFAYSLSVSALRVRVFVRIFFPEFTLSEFMRCGRSPTRAGEKNRHTHTHNTPEPMTPIREEMRFLQISCCRFFLRTLLFFPYEFSECICFNPFFFARIFRSYLHSLYLKFTVLLLN